MNADKKGKIIIIFGFTFICGVLILLAVLSMNNDQDSRSQASDNKQSIDTPITANRSPVLLTEPPISVSVGESYNYIIKISDPDTDLSKIILSVKISPSWLAYINGSLTGVPEKKDIGTHKVVLNLNDGVNSVDKTFYVVVNE